MPGAPQPQEWVCLLCGPTGGTDFIGNIGLFVPLGLALRFAGSGSRGTIAAGTLFSLAIETLQWRLIPGRDASAGDLMANALGAGLGALLAGTWRMLLTPSPRESRRLAVTGCAVLLGLGIVGAWSLRPAPIDLRYFSQWQPVRHDYDPFPGLVVGLSIQGIRRMPAEMIDPSEEAASLGAGLLEVDARFIPTGTALEGTALIARLANPLGQAFELSRHGNALLYRSRRNSSLLALRSPAFALPDAFVGRTREVCARTEATVVVLCARDSTSTRSTTIPVTLGSAWQSLSPIEVRAPWLLDAGIVLVFALSFVLVTWWLGLAEISWSPVAVAALASVLLWAIPVLMGIHAGGRWEFLGVVIGTGIGFACRRRASVTSNSPAASPVLLVGDP